ncbi:general transcription factor II-I repeat domain-containing protein 2A-like [Brachionichthys hirsutus]|uniref:general transcription factor II-I repeat domain-containing protein 2A-like n=1 Tax=Brachionichthys hirsutus TaxID=412623 RepID=UPI003604D624
MASRPTSSRSFQHRWTKDYGFVSKGGRALCTLCCESVVCKTSNVQRHFVRKHKKNFNDESDEAEAINAALAKCAKPSSPVKKLNTIKNQATEWSYNISYNIAKSGKSFAAGQSTKNAFLLTAGVLFEGLPNKDALVSTIREMPLSPRTVESRISEMSENVSRQQTSALRDAPVFSVAVDENVDVNGVPRLAIVARFTDGGRIREELCCLAPMHGRATGADMAAAFSGHFEARGVDIRKIFSIAAGKESDFVDILEDRIGHPVVKLRCVIHREDLCARISARDLNVVVDTAVRLTNAARSSTHRQLRRLLEETNGAAGRESPVRWLGDAKLLERFVECIDAIRAFFAEERLDHPELSDDEWLGKLMFLADVTGHLDAFDLRLRSAGPTVLSMFEAWKAFVEKLQVLSGDIQSGTLRHFGHLRALSSHRPVDLGRMAGYMLELDAEFSSRFRDFQRFGPAFSFLIKPEAFEGKDSSPFRWMGIDDFETQLVELAAASLWASKFAELRSELERGETDQGASIAACWESLPDDEFSCLKKVAFALLSAFGSTHICDRIFSHMKAVLRPFRNRLTTEHSEACLKLKLSTYSPDIAQLSRDRQGQGSH